MIHHLTVPLNVVADDAMNAGILGKLKAETD